MGDCNRRVQVELSWSGGFQQGLEEAASRQGGRENGQDNRLIADAVTGQVDLRGWQPSPEDVVSDDDLAALRDDEAEPAEEGADGEEN